MNRFATEYPGESKYVGKGRLYSRHIQYSEHPQKSLSEFHFQDYRGYVAKSSSQLCIPDILHECYQCPEYHPEFSEKMMGENSIKNMDSHDMRRVNQERLFHECFIDRQSMRLKEYVDCFKDVQRVETYMREARIRPPTTREEENVMAK